MSQQELSPLVEIDSSLEFNPWPKIPRGQHESVTDTEKMDGTNSCIIIKDGKITGIQSRKRFISPGKESDNFGFAGWVHENAEQLIELGDGEHFGEWCGGKIQNNPHKLEEKTFFLFNTFRWGEHNPPPSCCSVVEVLSQGEKTDSCIEEAMKLIHDRAKGTDVEPEGVIVYYHTTRRNEKYTFKSQRGKWRDS